MPSLTELIDPWNAAEKNVLVSGSVDLSQLPRLIGLRTNPIGIVQCELKFFRDAKRRHCVQGRVEGKVSLICQRCLSPMDMLLEIDVLLALVSSNDEAMKLPENYEPLIITDSLIKPLDIVEDELILALPDIPVHEDENCFITDGISAAALHNESLNSFTAVKHPFQCLKPMKN